LSSAAATQPEPRDEASPLELTDPRAMRALAHPLRLAILEHLDFEGTATATECGRATGESPQTCSYHLRALAKWGFVRRVESGDGRETRWTLAARGVTFATGAEASPEYQAASSLLKARVLERDAKAVTDFLQHETELEPEWREAATFLSGGIHATPAEVEELGRAIAELLGRLRRPRREERPAGARPVHVVVRAVPRIPAERPQRKERT
jgi:DNA-binding transcriptional ArsR family regulator